MSPELLAFALALLAATFGVLLYRISREALRFSGARVVLCPETRQPAGVGLKRFHAAAESLFGKHDLELAKCTRWPERQGCGQECLKQIESAPDGCLVSGLVQRFYAGEACAICGKGLDPLKRTAHRPALLGPDRVSVQWHEVPVEQLPFVLSTHRPICWDCHIVETLVRTHPELPVVRPARPAIRA